jgi:hypothetical protein
MSLLSAIGGFFGHKAQKKQAKKNIADYTAAQTGSINALSGARDASLGYFQPYAEGGQEAFAGARNMLQPGYDYTSEDPSFKFGLDTGVSAIDRSAAARHALDSGGTLKALARFGTDYGTTKFGESFDRQNQLAKFGFNAANQMSGVQSGYAGGVSNALFDAAGGRSKARTAKGDAIASQWGDGVEAATSIASFFL